MGLLSGPTAKIVIIINTVLGADGMAVRFNYHGKHSLVLGNRNRLQYYHKPLNNPIPIFNSIPSIYLVSLLGQQNFSRFSFSAFPLIFVVFSLYLSGSSQFCYRVIIILFSDHNESILQRIVHWNSSPHVLPLIYYYYYYYFKSIIFRFVCFLFSGNIVTHARLDAVLLLIHLYRKLKSRFGDKSRWRVIICCKQL